MCQPMIYSKCSKTSYTFLFLKLKCWAEIHKMFVRIANREDPDQKQSDLGLSVCLDLFGSN